MEINLLPETKSQRTRTADIVIAYRTRSGLTLGLWLARLRQLWPDAAPEDPLIRGRTGTPWTSHYYRHQHVYPWLRMLQMEGDPLLQAYDDQPGNRLEDKFYNMNMYRRGGESSVTKRGTLFSREERATKNEIYEHGRWRRRRDSEDMPTRYREWTLLDRLAITLMCM